MQIMYESVAGIDVHKKQITVSVPTAGPRRGRQRRYATFFIALREMVRWLAELGVTHVAMEATGIYWATGVARAGRARTVRGPRP